MWCLTLIDQIFFHPINFTQSTQGTYVNRINYKGSRCILSNGDKLGFGCTTTNRHLNDVNDYKYHVYRLTNENELGSNGPIELLDSDDEETVQTHQNGQNNNEDSGDECASADEMDIKPDIHTLMRQNQEEMKIKEEVAWNCYEYERQAGQREHENNFEPVDNVDLDQFDVESEIYVNEPPQKRQRHESNEFDLFCQPNENEIAGTTHDDVQPDAIPDILNNSNLNVATEYQLSETTLKEKVKNVTRSRGQQLAADMIAAAAQSKDKPKGAVTPGLKPKTPTTSSLPNNPIASTSKAPINIPSMEIPPTYGNDHEIKSVDELENDFISEITKWNYKWIDDKNLNPLQYLLNVRHLDTDFTDLNTFQQFVSSFGLIFYFFIWTQLANF